MYVYLIAPTAILLAMYIGFWPKQLPPRAYVWLVVIDILLAVGEYFSGYFPTINLLFWLFIIVFVIVIRLVRIVIEQSMTYLAKNRMATILLLVVLFVAALAVIGGFAIVIAALVFGYYQSTLKKGPHKVGQSASASINGLRAALAKLGPFTMLVLAAVFALIISLGASSIAQGIAAATTYQAQANLVNAKAITSLPHVNATDIPIVEKTNASIVLANAIGGLGPQYHVSSQGLAIVRFHGQLIWAAPLEFNNGLIWLTKHASPGYVWTSASNPSAKPNLVLGQQYYYTPQAGFGFNLNRVLYQHYPAYYLGTTDWEVDTTGQGYWITSLYKPAPGLTGLITKVIVGSAMTNPTTGATIYYPLGKQPAWISQIVGPNFAQNEANRYGWDRAGFFAATFTHQNTTQPVHSTPYNVLMSNGALGWEIPMSSPNTADNSLAGLILIDAESNQVSFTPFTGVQNDMAASQRINGATINSTLSAGRPLLYNLANALAYVAPVINSSGIVQEVAVVDPHNTVQPIIAGGLADALSSWQSYLASGDIGLTSSSKGAGLKTTTGTVLRVASYLTSSGSSGSTVREYWLFLIGHQAYTANLSINPSVIPFVKPGDRVTITYVPGSAPYSITAMTDITLSHMP
jgi:hypothetical protein